VLVGLGEHARVGDHGHLSKLMGSHERRKDRDHRLGLGLVPLKRLHSQREPGGVGEQPTGDLRIQAAFLGEPGLTESVTRVDLKIQRGHVVEQQRRRPHTRVSRARRCQRTPVRVLGVVGQMTHQRPVGRRLNPDLGQYPQRVQLAGRLDDPREHQRPEHLIATGRRVEAQRVVRAAQRIPQVPHPGGGDLQWAARTHRRGQPEIEFALSGGHPLAGGRLERLHLGLVVP
jgi:hypothetical protein